MLQPLENLYAYFIARIDCTVKKTEEIGKKTAYLRLTFSSIPQNISNQK